LCCTKAFGDKFRTEALDLGFGCTHSHLLLLALLSCNSDPGRTLLFGMPLAVF
jgi:hypothetical protein